MHHLSTVDQNDTLNKQKRHSVIVTGSHSKAIGLFYLEGLLSWVVLRNQERKCSNSGEECRCPSRRDKEEE
jgi:hypothetical protein